MEENSTNIINSINALYNGTKEDKIMANDWLNEWLEDPECISDSNYILSKKTSLDYKTHVVILSVIKSKFMTYESFVSDETQLETYNILFQYIKSNEITNDMYNNYVKSLVIVAITCFPTMNAEFFEESLQLSSLLLFRSTLEFILTSNELSTSKRNLIYETLHNIFPNAIETIFKQALVDENALPALEQLSRISTPDSIYTDSFIMPLLELLSNAKGKINSVLSSIEIITIKRSDFNSFAEKYSNIILQALISVSGSSSKAVCLIGKILVDYSDKVERNDNIHKCFELLADFSWCSMENNEGEDPDDLSVRYWETWDVLIDSFAVRDQFLTIEELHSLFNAFYSIAPSGIIRNEIFASTKACMTIIARFDNDYVINGFNNAMRNITQQFIYSLAFSFQSIDPNLSFSYISTIFTQLGGRRNIDTELICALLTCLARALFYYPDNEDLYSMYYQVCSTAFSPKNIATTTAAIASMNYLALRREHLFTINDFTLAKLPASFLEWVEPELYKEQVVKDAVKLLATGTRFVKKPFLISALFKPFTTKITNFLMNKTSVFSQKHYNRLCKEKMVRQEEEEEYNDYGEEEEERIQSFFGGTFEDRREYDDDEEEEEGFRFFNDEPFSTQDLIEEDFTRGAELLITTGDDFKDDGDTEESLIEKIIEALELVRIMASSSSIAARSMFYTLLPFCIDFLEDVNDDIQGGATAVSEIYFTVEVILTRSDLSFSEIEPFFKKLVLIAKSNPKHCKYFIRFLSKLILTYSEVQLYLLTSYESFILPNVTNISQDSATPEALDFLISANFWNLSLPVPVEALKSFKKFSIHESDSVLKFIENLVTLPPLEYVSPTLQEIGGELVRVILEMLTDSVYNRFFNTSVKALKEIITAFNKCGAESGFVAEMITEILNELIPQGVEKIPSFVETLLSIFEDLNQFYQCIREFLIDNHCCVTSDYLLYEFERDMQKEDDKYLTEISDDDDDDDNWDDSDVEIDEEQLRFEEEARMKLERKKQKEEELRRKEEEERDAPVYFFGGFCIDRGELMPKEEEEDF